MSKEEAHDEDPNRRLDQAHQARSGDVRCSTRVSSPVTICSSIVLPADYASWDAEKLRIVLAHERSHIRQGDFYLQLLAGITLATLFCWTSDRNSE